LGIDFYIECKAELALYLSDPVYTNINVMADNNKKEPGQLPDQGSKKDEQKTGGIKQDQKKHPRVMDKKSKEKDSSREHRF
jgi:hypothetical protein